ncbi:MAG: site-specific DNA-methyltransferase [Pseudomonas fluorescens]|nr:MAG: site-specific DNA-methyltransferase [Pseudomonas fluorescens]
MPTLQWLDRDKTLKTANAVPYRLLEAVPELGYGEDDTHNMLIEGDNLEALKALLPYYAGKVKCIFIDPPYNTKSAFEHYDDNLEHSKWLAMMYPRLELLRELLAEDGSIWVTIDDNEAHYLKVIMDEVFGRKNFIANVIWQKKFSPQNDAKGITPSHDHLIVYSKNKTLLKVNLLSRGNDQDDRFKNPDNDPRGVWSSGDLTSKTKARGHSYKIMSPTGKEFYPPEGRQWAPAETTFNTWLSEGRIWFGADGNNRPRLKQYLTEVQQGIVPLSIWLRDDVGDNQEAKREINALQLGEMFETPKPERLIRRVFELASEKGEFVLDSFLGSGTTAAVAHKMGRRYIGIEMGEHARTHCAARLKKVVDGEQGGISEAVGWQGGGGFRYYKLGEPIFDERGQINKAIRFEHLAAHIWFAETGAPLTGGKPETPLLGIHNGIAYYLLYNGILGDKRPAGGNVLTSKVWEALPPHDGPKVIYGEATRLGPNRLSELQVAFKQTPYDIKAR